MSRHRDIRNMDYSDEYDGYDDVYGHSVDDDYYISPSNRQFLYNRENSTRSSEGDIKEEDEIEAQLSDVDKAKLDSCIDQIKGTLGSTTMSRSDMVNVIVSYNFNVEQALNAILEDPKFRQMDTTEPKEKDVTKQTNKLIPKLNGLKNINSPSRNEGHVKNNFSIPKIFSLQKNLQENTPPKKNNFVIPKLNVTKGDKPSFTIPSTGLSKPKDVDNRDEFNSLSELVSSHLKLTPVKSGTLVDQNERQPKENLTKTDKVNTRLGGHILSDSKSLTAIENKTLNDWHIDLSLALKSTSSVPSICSNNKQQQNLEQFHIPFVDCEEKILPKNRRLTCTFDIHDILMLPLKNRKCNSRFGRALCRNYKISAKPIIRTERYISNIKKFKFNVPSPDDIISSHLKR